MSRYGSLLIAGCSTNYECLMKDPNKPICDGGMCRIGLLYYQKKCVGAKNYRKYML